MTTKIKIEGLKSFPTRRQLNKKSIYNLSLIALESKVFRDMVIDFLISRQFKREIIFIDDIKMSIRLKSALRNNDIKSLNELTFLKIKDVAKMPGIANRNTSELVDIMNLYDFQFDSNIEGLEVFISN
jgi:DNA-directed RNA polymerase alpha subunit